MSKDRYVIARVDWPNGHNQLQEVVNEKIEEGYIPVGGIVVWNDKLKGCCMAQALIYKSEA
tara:strand:+ start:1343 stop:1525 length:183 start_codon:yes stop_codon:yes gene_type:complete